jgi:hypothetical protein
MYRIHDGKIYGVLNDFDLSYQMTPDHPDPDRPSSNQRTGTLPFMAIDLLDENPPVHGYRHDLESFMWVILFHIGQYQDGKSLGTSGPYYNWLLGNRAEMGMEKTMLMKGQAKLVAQSAFRPLLRWIRDLAVMFAKASFAHTMHAFDQHGGQFDVRSSGGFITLEKVEKIFGQDIFAPITSPATLLTDPQDTTV